MKKLYKGDPDSLKKLDAQPSSESVSEPPIEVGGVASDFEKLFERNF